MEYLRPLLTTYAYNITGCIDDARDIVQDVFVRYLTVDEAAVQNQEAYLKRMVINSAINFKKKHKKIISATYSGEWLPEPVADDFADSAINKKDILSYSLMVLLEKLNPRQRAVFILKEAFDYEHDEIGTVIGISEENSRQLLARARKQIRSNSGLKRVGFRTESLNRYLQVLQQGDPKELEKLLNEEILCISDGGGKASAGINPIYGRRNVAAMLSGLYKKFYHNRTFEVGLVNHQPALFHFEGKQLISCQIFETREDSIENVFILRNPDKLALLEKRLTESVTRSPESLSLEKF